MSSHSNKGKQKGDRQKPKLTLRTSDTNQVRADSDRPDHKPGAENPTKDKDVPGSGSSITKPVQPKSLSPNKTVVQTSVRPPEPGKASADPTMAATDARPASDDPDETPLAPPGQSKIPRAIVPPPVSPYEKQKAKRSIASGKKIALKREPVNPSSAQTTATTSTVDEKKPHGSGFFWSLTGIAGLILVIIAALIYVVLLILKPGTDTTTTRATTPNAQSHQTTAGATAASAPGLSVDPSGTPATATTAQPERTVAQAPSDQIAAPEPGSSTPAPAPVTQELDVRRTTGVVNGNDTDIVDQLEIVAVLRDAQNPAIVIRNVAYRAGDIIDPESGLRLTSIDLSRAILVFTDADGNSFRKQL